MRDLRNNQDEDERRKYLERKYNRLSENQKPRITQIIAFHKISEPSV